MGRPVVSIGRLMNQAITIRRRTAATPDAEGNPVSTSEDVPALGRLEQQATDDRIDGDRRSTRFLLYLPSDASIDGGDQVVADARTFEVEGSPNLASTPRGPHHWEVTLREVTP